MGSQLTANTGRNLLLKAGTCTMSTRLTDTHRVYSGDSQVADTGCSKEILPGEGR